MTVFAPIEIECPKLSEKHQPLTEYAKKNNMNYKNLQQACIDGRMPTAVKIGNQWFVDNDVVYIVARRTLKK